VNDQGSPASSELPRTLPVSFNEQLGYAVMGMAVLGLGFMWRRVSPVPGYILMALAVVFAVMLFVRRPKLVLDRDGFTTTSLFGAEHTRWADVMRFDARKVAGRMVVAVDFIERGKPSRPKPRAFGLLPRAEPMLPHNYGMRVDELANLMNDVKARADRGEL
jgi:hypothetical protein